MTLDIAGLDLLAAREPEVPRGAEVGLVGCSRTCENSCLQSCRCTYTTALT